MSDPITLRDLAALDVSVLKGVGDVGKESLHDYGVDTVLDLITTYPRRWVDRTNEARVSDLVPGQEALVFYDPESTSELNAAAMSDAAAAVATGEVTQAVRDTNSDAGAVRAGDWIGLVRGDGLVAIGGTMVAASCSLLDKLVTPGRELMTIITGDLATARATEEIVAYVAENFDGVEVEVHAGGQPLYPYLFGVE